MSLLDKVKTFNEKKVLVIGDVMIDHYIYGHVTRNSPDISPPKYAPVVLVDRKTSTLGGAANVAANIASLGGQAKLFGPIGADLHGNLLEQICLTKGIIPYLIKSSSRPTTTKTRLIISGEYDRRIDEEVKSPIEQEIQESMLQKIRESLPGCDCIILSDYDKGTLTKYLTGEIISSARAMKKYVFVDPKPQNIDYFNNCTLVCPNRHEAEKISNITYSLSSLPDIGAQIKQRINSSHVIITCSEDGMFCYTGPDDYHHTPTVAKKVVDISGAGDTALAGLALAMCSGLLPKDAAMIGNFAAGLVLAKQGTETITNQELQEYIINTKIA